MAAVALTRKSDSSPQKANRGGRSERVRYTSLRSRSSPCGAASRIDARTGTGSIANASGTIATSSSRRRETAARQDTTWPAAFRSSPRAILDAGPADPVAGDTRRPSNSSSDTVPASRQRNQLSRPANFRPADPSEGSDNTSVGCRKSIRPARRVISPPLQSLQMRNPTAPDRSRETPGTSAFRRAASIPALSA